MECSGLSKAVLLMVYSPLHRTNCVVQDKALNLALLTTPIRYILSCKPVYVWIEVSRHPVCVARSFFPWDFQPLCDSPVSNSVLNVVKSDDVDKQMIVLHMKRTVSWAHHLLNTGRSRTSLSYTLSPMDVLCRWICGTN